MFKNLLDNAPTAVLVSRISDGEVLYANHKLAAMVGLSLDQLIGKKTPDFYFDPSDRERVLEVLRTKGKVENFELHLKRADGTPFWVETSFEPKNFEGEPAIFAAYTDITERKQVEEALQLSEQKLSTIFQTSPNIITITGLKDGLFYDVNDTWLAVTGYTRDELIGRTSKELNIWVNPEHREQVVALMKTQQYVRNFETEIAGKDGHVTPVIMSIEWIEIDGEQRLLSVGTDITERKRAEDALRESEERYALAAKGTNDGLWEWNIETNEGHFSARWKEILGFAEHELDRQRETFTGMLHPDDFDRTMQAVRDHLEKRVPYNIEYRLRHKQGNYVWIRCKAQAVWDENNKPTRMAGSISDITVRKRAEEALRQNKERLTDAVESMNDGFALFDADDRLVLCNRKYQQFWPGIEDLLVPGTPFINIARAIGERELIVDAVGRVDDWLRERAEQHRIAEGSTEHLLTDGRWVEAIDRRMSDGGVVCIRTDITERKRAEEKLADANRYMRGILDSTKDSMFTIGLDRAVQSCNKAATEMFGYSESEIVGETTAKFYLSPADYEATGQAIFESLAEKGFFEGIRELRRADGTLFPAEILGTLLELEGKQKGIVAIIKDITERKLVEDQLRQAQKMEAVGQLTGGVAHDFNNLLTVVLGNLELLRDETEEHDKKHRFVESAIQATERGAILTARLLSFSRKQTLNPKGLDLNEQVAGMSDMLQRTLGETIEIEAKAAEGLWPALADPAQVESALLNLALNARDAMPDGGKLTIEAANIKIDDDYVAAHADVGLGEYVLLSVSDTGTGMTQEAVQRAFEPFFTTKEVGEGSGLGLSMVYGFAKQSGGHLSIYSEEGHGTTVKLYLPRAEQVDLQVAPDVAPDGSGAREETILVVEDDPDVRTLAVTLLGDLGYDVMEAGDGASAIAAMKSRARIDLLFTDVILAGGMSGPVLAEEAKRIHPAMRFLFMSGYPSEAMVQRGDLDEGADMLNKPFRKADLAGKIRSALGKAAPVASDSTT